ncbi:hypothetical protein H4S08_004824 [Coemansia sp. RSA 1365]|nr:hypothetical protein H4S08_004824 [Coemansia sp. RSA 1365]
MSTKENFVVISGIEGRGDFRFKKSDFTTCGEVRRAALAKFKLNDDFDLLWFPVNDEHVSEKVSDDQNLQELVENCLECAHFSID